MSNARYGFRTFTTGEVRTLARKGVLPFVESGTFVDLFGQPAAAYSLRRLSSTATNCIRVRRSSDNAEQDIGFVGSAADSAIDTTDLLTFVGAGNDGFVTTWYDQSTNGRNATQTTAGNQPRIVNSGSVITENSNPAMEMVNSSGQLLTATIPQTTQSSFITYRNKTSGNDSTFVIPFCSTNDGGIFHGVKSQFGGTSPNGDYGTPSYYKNGNLISSPTRGTLFTEFVTDIMVLAETIGGGNSGSLARQWQYPVAGLFSNTIVSEVIIFDSDKSSDRTAIETNIDDYYNVF
jgi:hypothetical protein